MVIDHGTQDLSTRSLPREPEAIPQHLPKFFTFAQKGPKEPQLVSGTEMANVFGMKTFDEASVYANQATPFINGVAGQANSMMLQRLVPEDAGPAASIILWLDVLPTSIDIYKRNADGSIAVDALGTPTVNGVSQGYKVKWVATSDKSATDAALFGQRTVMPGDQVDTLKNIQSQRYPIFELRASSQGEDANLAGIRLWAPTTKTVSAMPTKMMATHSAYPYFISVIRRPDRLSAPGIVSTTFGEQKLMVTFKPGVKDPTTGLQLYIGDSLVQAYQNLTDPRFPVQQGDFGALSVYSANIELLVKQFQKAEQAYLGINSDFTADPAQAHLFNFISGVSSQGVPYNSFVFVDSANSVRLSDYTNVYAAGGSNGTMDNANYNRLVIKAMADYLDPNSQVQERAIHVESMFYDTGLSNDAKLALINAIALRRDTAVTLSTYDVDGPDLSPTEEHSAAVGLRTRLQMFPESDYFGTPVMRGVIVGRSCRIRNSQWTKRVPLTYELAIKRAAYMGAGNGMWASGYNYDGAPGSIVEHCYDISIKWVPNSVRNRNWDIGLNWAAAYDRSSFFFPAIKTVYPNDTSVLNSDMTMLAICYLNKLAHKVWREFSGVSGLSNAQLVKRVNDYANSLISKKFDNRFIIQPNAQITDMDNLRGYSWSMPWKLYSPGMKTVMSTYTQAYRIEDIGL